MALDVKFVVLCFVSLFLGPFASQNEHTLRRLCVTPDNQNHGHNSVYPHNCTTLSSYSLNSSSVFNFSNTEYIFFSGLHRLESDLVFDSLFEITLKSNVFDDSDTQMVLIECAGEVGFIFRNVTDLVIEGLTFSGCSSKLPKIVGGINLYFNSIRAGLYFNAITNLTIIDTVVQKSVGFGVLLVQIIGSSFITNCSFHSNAGVNDTCSSGGNALLAYYKCLPSNYTQNLNFEDVTFSDGESRTGSASGLIVLLLSDACIDIYMTRTIMKGNKAGEQYDSCLSHNSRSSQFLYGGNMAVVNYNHHYTNIFITNCSFSDGSAVLGGGLFVHYHIKNKRAAHEFQWMRLGSNCSFVSNKAYSGGGAYFVQTGHHLTTSTISISDSVFVSNEITGAGGAGIVAEYRDYFSGIHHSSMINISNCRITDNRGSISFELKPSLSFSMVSAALLALSVSNLLIENTIIERNQVTGIFVTYCSLIFQGDVSISNNNNLTGIGGGIFFTDFSRMLLRPNTNVIIAQNHASYNGGGLFIEDYYYLVSPVCFFKIDCDNFLNETDTNRTLDSIQVSLVNNTAGYAGKQLYGGQIDDCVIDDRFNRDVVLERVFTFYPNMDPSFISSDPQNIYFCDDNLPQNKSMNVTVYSGDYFNISLLITGQKNGTVPGIAEFTQYYQHNHKTSISFIGEISNGCATYMLHPTALTNNTATRTVVLAVQVACAYTSFIPNSYLYINFFPTPLGFRSNETKDSWVYACIQHPPIEQHGFHCLIYKHQSIVLRPPPYWLGHTHPKNGTEENLSRFVLYLYCPRGYCVDENVSIHTDSKLFLQDDQCCNNRTGVLCGQCPHGLSLSMGTSECLNCTHFSTGKTLGLVLTYDLVVVALVCVILILNMTVTQGTMSGFLFYVNSMFIFWPVLSAHHQSPTRYFMYHLISATNIVFGPNYCFYDGMDLVGLTWVRFANVAFLWIMTGVIIVICRRFQWASNFVGHQTVPVLATVVLLSHTKLNINIIVSVTPSVLNYYSPDGNVTEREYVMHYDGNVPYCGTKHFPLFIVGVLLVLGSLCFTFLLLCIQPLQRYSHLKFLRWVNRFKPFFDAYSCPHIIKPHCRFWNGFLLVQRSIMYSVYTWIGNYPKYILLTIFSVCAMILSVAWVLGGVYKQKYLQFLNFSYILNLGILSLLLKELKMYEFSDRSTSLDVYAEAICIASVSIAFLTFLATILYHCYLQLHGSRLSSWMDLRLRRARNKVCMLFRRNSGYQDLGDCAYGPDQQSSLLMPSYSNVSILPVKSATSPQFREPLLLN